MGVTRRQVVIGGAAAAALAIVGGYELIEQRVLPGKTRLDKALGKCGTAPPVPTNATGPMVNGSFVSQARAGNTVTWTISYPPGSHSGDALPVVIALPGRGGNDQSVFSTLHMQRYQAHLVEDLHIAPFVIASADGGKATCWHKRADGDDPASMVMSEFVPLLSKQGLITDKYAMWGHSLGGYGAVHIAMLAGSAAVPAVVGSSPALWRHYGETAPGTFDSAPDFGANTVWGRQDLLASTAVRLDVGSSDPFEPDVSAFRATLTRKPAGGVDGGCHDDAFAQHHLVDQLTFLRQHLSA
jgi:enterochelin esterase-like enzyme